MSQSFSSPLLMTTLVCDDIRQEVKGRTTNRLRVLFEFTRLRRWCLGNHGVTLVVWEGHLLCCSLTSAQAVPLKCSKCMINGHRVQVRVCGVEESQRRKHGEMGGGKWSGNSVWRENTALCHSFTTQVMTKWPCVMIGPYGLFCLAASSREVMIDSEKQEVKWFDALSARLCREHKLSVNLLLHRLELLSELLRHTSPISNSHSHQHHSSPRDASCATSIQN